MCSYTCGITGVANGGTIWQIVAHMWYHEEYCGMYVVYVWYIAVYVEYNIFNCSIYVLRCKEQWINGVTNLFVV